MTRGRPVAGQPQEPQPPVPRAERLVGLSLKTALGTMAGAYVVVYVCIAVIRLGYPFELEWMEGACVDSVARVMAGQPLYVEPTLEFTPFIYMPLYFYASAAVGWLTGLGFVPARLVSLLSSLACMLLIARLVTRESRSKLAGLVAAGLFAASFRVAGAFFDIARVDSLALALLLASAYVLRFGASRAAGATAGVLLCASFLTKQSALPAAAFLLGHMLMRRRAMGAWCAATFVVLAAGSTLVLDALHDGWFSYYVFKLPSRQETVDVSMSFWTEDLLGNAGFSIALLVVYLVTELGKGRHNVDFYVTLTGGAVLASYLMRTGHGGYDNALMPALAATATCSGLALGATWTHPLATTSRTRRALVLVTSVAGILQLLQLRYDPVAQLPTAFDRAAGDEYIRVLASLPGHVLAPFHGYIPTRAGKHSHAHPAALSNVIGCNEEAHGARLQRELKESIRLNRWDAIVLDDNWFFLELDRYYTRIGSVFEDDEVFFPVTGMRTRPKSIYLPRRRNDTPEPSPR